MQADISGSQRKILTAAVRPLKASHGAKGILVRDGRTLGFEVVRAWSAPAGHYREQWFLVDPTTSEVLYEGPLSETLVWGLQSLTEKRDEVSEPIELAAGTYKIVFALNSLSGGDIEVSAVEAPAEAA